MDFAVIKLTRDGITKTMVMDSAWEADKFATWAPEYGFTVERLRVAATAGSCNEAIEQAWRIFGLPHGGGA